MRSRKRLKIAFTLVLLTLGLAIIATAQEGEKKESSLTGQISEDSTGQYVLTDPDNDDQVSLRGSDEELAEHVGAVVTVTGRWVKDDYGKVHFQVSTVKPADA